MEMLAKDQTEMPGRSPSESKSDLPTSIKIQRSVPGFVRKLGYNLFDMVGLASYREVLFNSPLRRRGWFRSYESAPVDENGNPLPWLPYPLIDFAERRLEPSMRVFEYGGGNSTRWFASQVDEVVSVENDESWYRTIKSQLPENSKMLLRDLDEYPQAITDHGEFDVVLIDGRRKVECAKMVLDHLADDGIIFWDDTYRERYADGVKYVENQGFRKIVFEGMGPVTALQQETSVLYRDDNCLGI